MHVRRGGWLIYDCVIGTWRQEIWKLMVSMPGTTWSRSG
jgi:hypothetical protein